VEFSDGITNLVKRIRDMASAIETEEATKNALIMPFIRDVLTCSRFPGRLVLGVHAAVLVVV